MSKTFGFIRRTPVAFCITLLIAGIQCANVLTRKEGIANVFLTKFNIYSETAIMFLVCGLCLVISLLLRFKSEHYSQRVHDLTAYSLYLSLLGCAIGAVAFPLLMPNVTEGRYVNAQVTIQSIEQITGTEFDETTQTFKHSEKAQSEMTKEELATGLYNAVAASKMRFATSLFIFNNLVGTLGVISLLIIILASVVHMRELKTVSDSTKRMKSENAEMRGAPEGGGYTEL